MAIVEDVRIFKIRKDKKLNETDILLCIKKILGERKEMPVCMELEFVY